MATRGASRVLVFTFLFLGAIGVVTRADDDRDRPRFKNPCVADDEGDSRIVYDAQQNICWLADANLAGDPETRALMNVPGINPNGTMDWPTALQWVDALNNFDGSRGYLGHNDWQLPVTPNHDDTCSSDNNGSVGASCTGSALGNLYAVGLARRFPDSVVRDFENRVGPFRDLVPGLYWTIDSNSEGEETFSFANGLHGSNTTKYNYLHVLPMVPGAISTPPAGTGVMRYADGAAAGTAVYDSHTGYSWALHANLAAHRAFGIKGTTTITSSVNGTVLTVPLIDHDGTMLFDTAHQTGGWIDAMNAANYAGASAWQIPSGADLETLFNDLNLAQGSVLLESHKPVGPFRNFQPFFYWACQRDQKGDSQSPCNPLLNPPPNPQGGAMRWSFDFDDGFQGTDETTKEFYVLVYYPAPHR